MSRAATRGINTDDALTLGRATTRLILAASVAGGLNAPAAFGQPIAATIRVVHDDLDGIIEPGQSINIRVAATWQPQVQFAGARFDVIAGGDVGQVSNLASQLYGFNQLSQLGQIRGGSVIGRDLVVVPNYFTSSPTPGSFSNSGVDLLRYTWTAPSPTAPTPVSFTLVPDPLVPDVRFYPLLNSPAWVFGQTTWLGTSVVVLPGPGGLVIAGIAWAGAGRRRRRTETPPA